MGLGDLWSRTLVYFGIAEDEEWDEDGYLVEDEVEERPRRRDRQNVRRLPSAPEADEWASSESAVATTSQRSRSRERDSREPAPRLRSVDTGPPAKVHLVAPRSFNDAQQIADRFKAQIPVI